MNLIKRLIPNNIKQEGKYFLYDVLKIPYNRFGVPIEIVKWLPPVNPVNFIDIGASKGSFAQSLNSFYKVNKAVLIEPIVELIPVLKSKFSDETKFQVVNKAVSEKSGEAEFYLAEELNVMSSLLKINDEFYDPFLISSAGKKITVDTDTLDHIASQYLPGMIDLLKIDVQGAEHLVLKSGIETLKRTKLVYTEFSYRPMYEGSATFFDIYTLMNENNFRFAGATPARNVNGEIVQGDGLFVNNIICP